MKGICFKEEMFLATIKGYKSQTRRLFSEQPTAKYICCETEGFLRDINTEKGILFTAFFAKDFQINSKYKYGEVLFLKEPYSLYFGCIFYKYGKSIDARHDRPWRNKLFMPASASRYKIKINCIRCERLQNISDEDCKKEGIVKYSVSKEVRYGIVDKGYFKYLGDSYKEAYKNLIDSINGKGTWDSNPWVWVYSYILVE